MSLYTVFDNGRCMICDSDDIVDAGSSKNVGFTDCSLSLWRVVRGSKLMHLDLIHGLFIT